MLKQRPDLSLVDQTCVVDVAVDLIPRRPMSDLIVLGLNWIEAKVHAE